MQSVVQDPIMRRVHNAIKVYNAAYNEAAKEFPKDSKKANYAASAVVEVLQDPTKDDDNPRRIEADDPIYDGARQLVKLFCAAYKEAEKEFKRDKNKALFAASEVLRVVCLGALEQISHKGR